MQHKDICSVNGHLSRTTTLSIVAFTWDQACTNISINIEVLKFLQCSHYSSFSHVRSGLFQNTIVDDISKKIRQSIGALLVRYIF